MTRFKGRPLGQIDFASHGEKIPFKIDPFQKGIAVQKGKQEVTIVIPLVKNGGEICQMYAVLLNIVDNDNVQQKS